jgi:L-ascorbate metabolism protein UlaG (beta-lactamase superfamily)
MDITWFGRSCFRLQSGQVSVLTDPYDLPRGAPPLAADIVTLSSREARGRLATRAPHRVVDGPGEYEIKGIPVTGIATPAPQAPASAEGGEGGEGGAPAYGGRRNLVYTILLGGVAVCHLGRLNRPPTAQQIQEIGLPDVVLLPLGEPYGLPVQRAVELASQLEAKVLVPMTLGGPNDRAALEGFCRELGADPAAVEPSLSLTPSGLPVQARVAPLAAQEPS